MNQEDKSLEIVNKKNNSNIPYIIVIIILFLGCGVLGWLYYNETQKSKTLYVQVTDTNREKEEITLELDSLLVQYDGLKTNNDTLNAKLIREQERIKQLVDEIKNIKNATSYQIAQYKKELNTLREIMRNYVVQIDSLNTKNQILTAENIKVKTEFKRAQNVNKQLTEQNETLNTKVAIASVIKAKNISATPLNKKGKDVNKAGKVDKVQVCFTLTENELSPPGARFVYIRIARPDELVLASSENDFFSFQGNQIVFSAKREVDYMNKDLDVCLYWKNNEELIPGKYVVDIFTDGSQIGSAIFELR